MTAIDRVKLEEAIRHARKAIPWQYVVVCDAAEAHLATLPKTKVMEVWRVESTFHGNLRIWQDNLGGKAEAEHMARYLATDGHKCIRVTGPHQQCVPA